MTFGDVLAITLLIVVTVVTLWAGIVAFTVIFSRRAQVAANALTDAPGKQVGLGIGIFALSALVSVALMSKGGPISIIGFAIAASVLAVAVLGSAGLALVVAERIRGLEPTQSRLTATFQGAALAVAAGLIPVIGWFFLLPAAVFASLGAGISAMTAKPKPERQAVPLAAEI